MTPTLKTYRVMLPEVGVQGALERALGTALQEDRGTLRMTAAARTDAGVHAAGQARPQVGLTCTHLLTC